MADGSGLGMGVAGGGPNGGRAMAAIAGLAAGARNAAAPKPRLSRSDWIMAGFRALVIGGADAIRIEALARELGATKGSFYWHFKDLHALHAAMLAAFESLATTEITSAVRRAGDARAQAMRLVDLVSAQPEAEAGGAALEPALRDWARVDQLARSTMERVDAQRLADLCGFLTQAGMDTARAAEGAVRFYAAMIGLEALRITCGVDMRGPLAAVAMDILEPGD